MRMPFYPFEYKEEIAEIRSGDSMKYWKMVGGRSIFQTKISSGR